MPTMTFGTEKVTPECKYGHGELIPVKALGGTSHAYVSLLTPQNILHGSFLIEMFMCPKCGYLETFDPEPNLTLKQISGNTPE